MPTTDSQLLAARQATYGSGNTLITAAEEDAFMQVMEDWVNTKIAAAVASIVNPAPAFYGLGAHIAAPGNVTLSGIQTIDGQPGFVGMRVALPFQTNAADRRVWVMGTGGWVADTNPFTTGMLLNVATGNLYGGTQFQVSFSGSYVAGTTALSWVSVGGGKQKTPVQAGGHCWAVVAATGNTVAPFVTNPTGGAGFTLPVGAANVQVFSQDVGRFLVPVNEFSHSSTGLSGLAPQYPAGAVFKIDFEYASLDPAFVTGSDVASPILFVDDAEASSVPDGAQAMDVTNSILRIRYDGNKVIEIPGVVKTI